ncbi:MAG: Calcineurin-like phosphoesterase superfamily domain protein [Synergistetes bacterium ADurb.BinA166]|nr:MAG: Calcineurin-like phosphoesterase superfamily domain protein [Synergistetes bacterium ADurb.BinA166]
MSSIRLLTSSDEHLADLAPGFRKDDYRGSVLRKLEWQGDMAKRFEADAVLRGGDFFHVKPANKTTMRTMAMAARIHRRYSCPTYAMAGNHDMSNNDPDSVPGQPLGVMLDSGVFRPMRDETFVSGSMKLRVVGVPYTTDIDVGGLHDLVRKKDETYMVAFVHALAAMAPEEKIQSFFNERVFDYRDLVFDGCPDVYVFGHYHKDQGIVDHLGVRFVNLGAISRGALTFENLDRKPKVSLITADSRGISVEEHVVPHEDASAVFDLDKKKKLDTERRALDDFISRLRSSTVLSAEDSVESRKKELDSYPKDLRDMALTLLEAAEAGTLTD